MKRKEFTQNEINELEQIFIMQYEEDQETAKATVKRLLNESPQFLETLLRINKEAK